MAAVSEILLMGDSVLKGVVFDAARQRYALLKESASALLSGVLPVPLVNRSQMGRTAPEGLAFLLSQPREALAGRAVVLEFGGNDCDLDWAAVSERPDEAHEARTPAAQFVSSLTAMVEHVRACGGQPLVSTLPPLDAGRYFEWVVRGLNRDNVLKFLGEVQRIYRWQEYYSALAAGVARALCCDVVPVREAFLEQVRGEDVMCLDGIHPNAAGQKIIAGAMAAFVASTMKESGPIPSPNC